VRAPDFTGAPCQTDPELWYSDNPTDKVAAVQVCKGCPLLALCREWVLTVEDGRGGRFGIVGGLTVMQRASWHRRKGTPRNHAVSVCGTTGGYKTHYRRGERPCEACRTAEAVARRGRAA